MPVPLVELVAPDHTAVLAMEMQRGVIGDIAMMAVLRDELEATGALDGVAKVCRAARAADVRVVHCNAVYRADRAGSKANSKITAMGRRSGDTLLEGTAGVEVVPELEPSPHDISMPRYHGLTPFTSTSLDQTLRNMGITTVVATGVSVNVGVLGMVISAVDLGYDVVLVRDAVAGVPHDYAQAVIDNTLSLLATIVHADDLVSAWTA